MSKNILYLLAIVAIVAIGIGYYSYTQQKPPGTPLVTTTKPNTVIIKNLAFNPPVLTVKVGATVTWTNEDDAPHTITSISGGGLASDYLSKGQSYSYTFKQPGTHNYYCITHADMKGTITVEA